MLEVGTTVLRSDGNVSYSEQFPGRGQAAMLVVNASKFSSTVGLGVTLQSKARNATSFGDTDSLTVNGTGTFTKNIDSDINEDCRLEYQFAAGGVATDMVTFTARVIFRPYA